MSISKPRLVSRVEVVVRLANAWQLSKHPHAGVPTKLSVVVPFRAAVLGHFVLLHRLSQELTNDV